MGGYSDGLYRLMTKNQFSDFCNVTVGPLFIECVLTSMSMSTVSFLAHLDSGILCL